MWTLFWFFLPSVSLAALFFGSPLSVELFWGYVLVSLLFPSDMLRGLIVSLPMV